MTTSTESANSDQIVDNFNQLIWIPLGIALMLVFLPSAERNAVNYFFAFVFWGAIVVYLIYVLNSESCDPAAVSWHNVLRLKCPDPLERQPENGERASFKALSFGDGFRLSLALTLLIGVVLLFRAAIFALVGAQTLKETKSGASFAYPQERVFAKPGGLYGNL